MNENTSENVVIRVLKTVAKIGYIAGAGIIWFWLYSALNKWGMFWLNVELPFALVALLGSLSPLLVYKVHINSRVGRGFFVAAITVFFLGCVLMALVGFTSISFSSINDG